MTNQQGRLRTRVAVFACVAAAALIVDQLTKLGDGRVIQRSDHSSDSRTAVLHLGA